MLPVHACNYLISNFPKILPLYVYSANLLRFWHLIFGIKKALSLTHTLVEVKFNQMKTNIYCSFILQKSSHLKRIYQL